MLTQQTAMLETLQRFLTDRHDTNFTSSVKEFLAGTDEERLRAFIFAITSAKIFANVILDTGEFTVSNAFLMQTLEVQVAKLSQDPDLQPTE